MIKSKVRRRRVAKWRRNGHPHPAFDALAMMGEYRHPELLFNGEVMHWAARLHSPLPNPSLWNFIVDEFADDV